MGILCHVTSLLSEYGVGDFGKSAREFIDFLSNTNISIWQILPLNETNKYNCPYASSCHFSYDEMFVDPESLVNTYKVDNNELKALRKLSKTKKVSYEKVKFEKRRLLDIAYNNLTTKQVDDVKLFIASNSHIFDYAYFKTLLEVNNTDNWRSIDTAYWNKKSKEKQNFIENNFKNILRYAFGQMLLVEQWKCVREYAKGKGVVILGDLPIYPDPNSFDVFNNPEAYQLDRKTYEPIVFGGVPKDDFCDQGQNWGTCIYDWNYLESKNYKYLIDKIKLVLEKYDILRLDHFLGYVEHYEVNAKNPKKGKWVKAGGDQLFDLINKKINLKKIVIEDLGLDKKEANRVRDKYGLKGMCVAQMILESKSNIRYAPHNVTENCLYYMGTHDNNTFLGYLKSLTKDKKLEFCNAMEIEPSGDKEIHLESIRKMLNSKSNAVIIQIQDLLMQGGKYRMNVPGQAAGCWEYKVPKNYMKLAKKTLSLL